MSTLESLPSNDPLQQLLRESLHLRQQSKKKSALLIKAQQLEEEYKDRLHNEMNWVQSGVVTVIHTSEDGVQTTIGMFQELRNKYIKDGRKLVRIIPDQNALISPTDFREERVSGAIWINGKQMMSPEPNYHSDPKDQELIRDYIKRTAPISLAQQLREMQSEHLLYELLHSDTIWQRV